jgi:SAM-dependent methyltransferase
VNYFAHPSAAERYAQDRLYFHPRIVERIRAFLRLDSPVPVGVDVGCGTGLSTLALTELADSVIGADISPAMLAQAPAHPRIRYLQAPAEQLPLPDHSADLITVSVAFHWLDRAGFLAEARRILRPTGTLVIYSRGFHGEMKENPGFAHWHDEVYLVRYPTPPRNSQPFTDEDARRCGLRFAQRDRYLDDVVFTPEQFVREQITHSNVIANVEEGGESLADVYAWTLASVRPCFVAPTGTFVFGGEIWYLQPASA